MDGFSNLGFGLGLRSDFIDQVISEKPSSVDWFEVISENFMANDGLGSGYPIIKLEKVRQDYPVVFHGVSMSLGSIDPLDENYLKNLKSLIDRIEPQWVSDHLCWTGAGGNNLHDLLPLPYTKEAADHVVSRIKKVQDFLGHRLMIENVSSYVEFTHSEMTEWEFLTEVANKSDCAILLDVNNVYVSSYNHGFDAHEYLNNIPLGRVKQIHLAGHSYKKTHLIDTHDEPVPSPVWKLYKRAIKILGQTTTMIERDDNIPELNELITELNQARSYATKSLENKNEKRSPELTTMV